MADLQIVQGDDKHIKVCITGVGGEFVSEVFFSSATLNLVESTTDKTRDDSWVVFISREKTKNLPTGVHTFDITARFENGDIKTGIYHGTVCVLKKDNLV